MKVIDPNSAAASLNKALVPGPSLVDGRTETELLSFMSEFATLINFYDTNNKIDGNWQPFLLKDPVFLLAYISKTDYQKEHMLFVNTCANLVEVMAEQASRGQGISDPCDTRDPRDAAEIVALFNQLLDQITRIFLHIERWTYYMQLGTEEYDLKKYVIDQVKQNFNAILWAVLALRNYLSSTPNETSGLTTNTLNQILPVRDYVLDSFTDQIWTEGGGTDPFMQVLGIYTINKIPKEPAGESTNSSGPIPEGITLNTQDYFTALKNTGNQLFKFYRTIVDHAKPEYEIVKNTRSNYPDTLLLRAFGNLMEVYRAELNQLAPKHLDFYYNDILKQSKNPAVADSVFITAVLGKNVTVFDLPAGTLFNAGTDAQKNPILFASTTDVSLNAALISNVYTLAPLTPVISDAPTDGSLDTTFVQGAGVNNTVNAVAVQNDGKIIIGGSFTTFETTTVNGIARLNTDGSLDTTFTTGTGTGLAASDSIYVIAIQADGKILIGGSITSFNGVSAFNILRLNADGTSDTISTQTGDDATNCTFGTGAGANGVVHSISIQHDECIVIGGAFTTYDRHPASGIVRITPDGLFDRDFTPGQGNNTVLTSAIQSDGKIIIGCTFTSTVGAAPSYVSRLLTDGSPDVPFNSAANTNGAVQTCAIQNDGMIIIAGDFTTCNDQPAAGIARLNSSGAIDPAFNVAVNAGSTVQTCTVQWDGKIVIGGNFTSVNGTAVNNLARLNTDGTLDTTFNPGGAGPDNTVLSSWMQSNGEIIVAGDFIHYNATPIPRVARLNVLMNPPQLFLQSIAAPGVVTTNEAGQAIPWNTFGGVTNQDSTAAPTKQMGFAFGSPMLFLPEGARQITIDLVFDQLPGSDVFGNAQIFLSTSIAWLAVPYSILPTDPDGQTLTVEIVLDSTQPAITAFTTNPDGLNSTWPMCKIVFNSFTGLAIPPVLTSIEIDVWVQGVSTFALYNDNGLLSTKTPFQLFGPIVNLNSNFLIGSNEIFSKPLKWLSVELDWDTLPPPTPTFTPPPATPPATTPLPALDPEFGVYYYSYNAILFPTVTSIPALEPSVSSSGKKSLMQTVAPKATVTPAKEQPAPAPGRIKTFFKKTWSVITWPVRAIGKLFRRSSKTKDTEVAESALKPVMKTTVVSPPSDSFTPPTPPAPGQSVPFSNLCFTVEFSRLNYNAWNPFYMYNYANDLTYSAWLNNPDSDTLMPQPVGPVAFQLFGTPRLGKPLPNNPLSPTSVFGYFASEYDTPGEPDPTIQNAPLVYDGTNSSGFIKMTLTNPANGFGASVYGNVVTNIVTQNALKITQSTTTKPVTVADLITTANLPFIPLVNTISAAYGATQVYNLTRANESYPVQCFYYTPFANYTAYDNSPAIKTNYSVNMSVVGDCPPIKGLQLVPSFSCTDATGLKDTVAFSGAMFIGFTGLVPANEISLFFELSTTYAAPTPGATVSYYYLSAKGWKTLSLLNDGTNQFTCSGIVTVNIPADITNQSVAMPGVDYWIAICASDSQTGETLDLASFAQVVLLSPNGIELTRSGSGFLADSVAPVISSLTITKPQTAIPQLGTITQPFPSFGGRAAESEMQMYERVSNRLKTKDRAVSGSDIFTIIRQQFPDIYFSSAVFTPDTNLTSVYVVEGFDSASDAGAYRPFVSECEMESIAVFLQERVSLFSNISVLNYSFQYLQVNASITVKIGYVPQAMSATVVQALNIYLSPWIAAAGQSQVNIGQPISQSQIAAFIRTIPGVESVSDVTLQLSGQTSTQQTLNPAPGTLFVSSLTHAINATQVT